ncbi:MAG: methyltransferase domain-containing protein [Blautia sp.]|nr:methyltransferase domain-containing protein [Blautia sp.]
MESVKHRIVQYWTQRAQAFQDQRIREFEDVKHERWLREIERYLPQDRSLRILDLGTGTGYFALILAARGHEVLGIDLTPEMISRAHETAGKLGIHADFRVMDAENPDFEPESFDVLVTRNLTWTLPDLEKTYAEWYRLLKPGGILINFDADYCRGVWDKGDDSLPDTHAHRTLSQAQWAENEAITLELSAYQQPRPQWDVGLLIEAGFEKICLDTGVYRRIYQEMDEFYNPTPVFCLAAYK